MLRKFNGLESIIDTASQNQYYVVFLFVYVKALLMTEI